MDYSSAEEKDITLMKPIVQCLIFSNNKQLLSSDVALKLHPDTQLFRLLQYLFEKYISPNITSSNLNPLTIDRFCFKSVDSANVLPLDISLHNIADYNYPNVELENREIILDLEIKTDSDNCNVNDNDNNSPCMIDLGYNFNTDFKYADLNIEFNLLSTSNDYCTNPVVGLDRPGMILDTKGETLREIVTNYLKESENLKTTLCSLNDKHTFNDILYYKIQNSELSASNKNDNYNEVNNDKFLNSTLLEILGIDFIPNKFSKFTLMFYIKHKYTVSSNETLLNFISDIPLLCDNKMIVNDDTSVIAIKSYIIQTFLIRFNIDIPISDILLFYQNKKLVDIDLDGNETTIRQYIGTASNPFIHVKIPSIDLKQLSDRIDSFWYKGYQYPSSDCDCDFGDPQTKAKMKDIYDNNNNYVENILNEDSLPSEDDEDEDANYIPSESSLISDYEESNVNSHEDDNEDLIGEHLQYRTESGHEIKLLNGLYRKCIIDGTEEAFIETKYLDRFQAKLRFPCDKSVDTFEMDEIPLSSMNQYKLHPSINRIELDEYIINELESNLKSCIVPEESIDVTISNFKNIQSSTTTTTNIVNGNRIIGWLKNLSLFVFLICKTLYYVIVTNLMVFILLFELIFFISKKWVIVIITTIVLKTIFFNDVVRDSWLEYFRLDRYSTSTLHKFQQFIISNQLSDEFYSKLLSSDEQSGINHNINDDNRKLVLQKLIDYKEFYLLTNEIWIKYNIIGNEDNVSIDLLKGYNNKTNLKNALRDVILLYLKELTQIDNDESIVENKRQFIRDMNELLYLVEKEVDVKEEENGNVDEEYRGSSRRRMLRILMNDSIQRLRHVNWARQFLEYIVPNPLRDTIFICVCKNVVLFVILLIPVVNIAVDEIINERKSLIEREEEKRRLKQEQEREDIEPERYDNTAESTGVEIHHVEEDQ